MNSDEFIRVKDAAELLGVTPDSIHHYRKQGLIQAQPVPAGKVTRYRLLRHSVLKWVKTEA